MNNIANFKIKMEENALTTFGKVLGNCNSKEKYIALSKTIMEDILPIWIRSKEKYEDKKQAYYFSAEYLTGRALSNNLINLGYKDELVKFLNELNIDYNEVEEAEEDAALGNGGLGRLAACFLDSAATLNYPLSGYGIRYEYGLFKQKFEKGFQVEKVDNWLEYGDPWSIRKKSESIVVNFSDGDVLAVPYDTPIIGYGKETINTLRLWKAEPLEPFDFQAFNHQKYDDAVKNKMMQKILQRFYIQMIQILKVRP